CFPGMAKFLGNLKGHPTMRSRILVPAFCLLLLVGLVGTAAAQEYSFSGDAALVSKYLWRGQRLTNDWSFQPAMTVGYGGFAFNTWGTMDLTAVNPAPLLPLDPNVDGADGMR